MLAMTEGELSSPEEVARGSGSCGGASPSSSNGYSDASSNSKSAGGILRLFGTKEHCEDISNKSLSPITPPTSQPAKQFSYDELKGVSCKVGRVCTTAMIDLFEWGLYTRHRNKNRTHLVFRFLCRLSLHGRRCSLK